jgi:hypothetical protein
MRMSTGAGPPGEKAPTKAAHVEPANAKDARCIYRSSSSEAMQVALHVTWQPATRSIDRYRLVRAHCCVDRCCRPCSVSVRPPARGI